jgi:inorganic pyrophosphatase
MLSSIMRGYSTWMRTGGFAVPGLGTWSKQPVSNYCKGSDPVAVEDPLAVEEQGADDAPMHLDELPVREPGSRRIHIVIDTPAGSRNKYRYDESLGIFRISRVLPKGAVFPHDFGSIPQTRAPDGDPLDVLVLAPAPSFPGCLMTGRLIGVLHAEQREGGRTIRNDRLIAVTETPVNRSSLRELSDLDPERLRDITHFFESYNRRQGRRFRIVRRGGRASAEAVLERAVRAFRDAHGG